MKGLCVLTVVVLQMHLSTRKLHNMCITTVCNIAFLNLLNSGVSQHSEVQPYYIFM